MNSSLQTSRFTRPAKPVPQTAMVLAAGLGKRMRPITEKLPKPLVRVHGKALIDHALDAVAAAGVARAIVNVHHLAQQLEEHLAARPAPQIVISDEREALLESGGGVAKALPLIGNDPFYILNSDTFWVEGYRPNLLHLAEQWDWRADGHAAAARIDPGGGRLWRGRRFQHGCPRPAGAAQGAAGCAVRLCRRGDLQPGHLHRPAAWSRFRSTCCLTVHWRRSACLEFASMGYGCMSARPIRLPRQRKR